MIMLTFFRFLMVFLIMHNTSGSKILGVFHVPSRSQHILGCALLKALADRGHEVTMISPFPLKHPYPNYRDVELTGMVEMIEDTQLRNFFSKQETSLFDISSMHKFMAKVSEFSLNHTEVKNLMMSKEKFDVVIQTYYGNDAYLGLAHHFDASSIIFSTIGSSKLTTRLTGNPAPLSCTPVLFWYFPSKMNFLQRIQNAVFGIGLSIFISIVNEPAQAYLLDKYFPKSPTIQELRNNISLVLLNSHFVMEGPRPYLPNMVQIGGFHIQPPKKLPTELKAYMDSAAEGVILFSLGSIVRSSELPKHTIEAIVKTFAALKQNVLWKLDSIANISHIPPNVMISSWLPQSDVLAHPNLKVFITHGGLLSTTEAVYWGVPIIGIPVFGDQGMNIQGAVEKGYAIKVEIHEISFENLSGAINELLTNTSYRIKAQSLSKLLKYNPISALSNAIYWVEYVINHDGAHHLKYVAMDLEWYQLYSIDVFLFLLGVLSLLILGLYYIMYKLPVFLIRKCGRAIRKQQKIKKK